MDRRPCLTLLKHLLLFGPVVGAGCCRARGQYKGGGGTGGNDGVRVVPRRAVVGGPGAGQVGSERAGVFYRGAQGERLSSVLSVALGPFFADRHRDRHAMRVKQLI